MCIPVHARLGFVVVGTLLGMWLRWRGTDGSWQRMMTQVYLHNGGSASGHHAPTKYHTLCQFKWVWPSAHARAQQKCAQHPAWDRRGGERGGGVGWTVCLLLRHATDGCGKTQTDSTPLHSTTCQTNSHFQLAKLVCRAKTPCSQVQKHGSATTADQIISAQSDLQSSKQRNN